MKLPHAIVVASLVLLSCTGTAHAAGRSDSARSHYKEGKAHYQLGEYREALQEFKEAYRLVQDAAFLFNVAQCHRQLREFQEAIRVYGAYLRDAPNAPNRGEVERLINEATAALEKQEKEKAAAAPPLPPPAPPPADPPPEGASTSAAPASTPPVTPTPPVPSTPPVAPAPPVTPAPPVAPMPPVTTPVPPRTDAELEVTTNLESAKVLVNRNQVGRKQAALRLPPGLYSVAIEADGYQGAEGAIALMAGDRMLMNASLLPVKSHGWRTLGHVWLALGLIGEGFGIVTHIKANEQFQGSSDFNMLSTMEKIGQTVAISSLLLATGSYVLDYLSNRGHVEPGTQAVLQPTRRTTP